MQEDPRGINPPADRTATHRVGQCSAPRRGDGSGGPPRHAVSGSRREQGLAGVPAAPCSAAWQAARPREAPLSRGPGALGPSHDRRSTAAPPANGLFTVTLDKKILLYSFSFFSRKPMHEMRNIDGFIVHIDFRIPLRKGFQTGDFQDKNGGDDGGRRLFLPKFMDRVIERFLSCQVEDKCRASEHLRVPP